MTPRAHECMRLVWERKKSREIAAELGISKSTVDGYIGAAVEELGARDRREAAVMLFGPPRTESGGDLTPLFAGPIADASMPTSTDEQPAARPWRSRYQPLNTFSLKQTAIWVAVIAAGLIVALAMIVAMGSGLPSVALPAIRVVRHLM
ncbi:DNA-binding CsgD family transcriptional regulator [Sphingomonas jinjuensis]|uniref:DNA-binding CsgD family transcriptional regulator n=1 Tax=Sphingomonas jinjuensis TaxID=535907 RepID=A0A840F931_9SPHN|nr:helix-turn-helix transcriptional regulator [Sphingomonas jinjuensis]MBB4153122.1 DNA-binding CsgD family transcriptional regulator [Sphingomonas jinjuensis]